METPLIVAVQAKYNKIWNITSETVKLYNKTLTTLYNLLAF